jgi:Replication-relaxation
MSMSTLTPPTTRSRRFHRQDNPPGFALDDRKIAVLRRLARHRHLTSEQLASMDGGSHQKMLRILRVMYDHGLIDRPPAQRYEMAAHENRPLVYCLAHAGARLLARLDGTSVRSYSWTTKIKRRKAQHIVHAIDTAHVMRAFTASIANRNWGLLDHQELIPHFPEATRIATKGKSPFSLRVTIEEEGEDEPRRLSVIPDRLFSPAPSSNSRFNFALELDEGGMPVFRWKNRNKQCVNLDETSIVRKLIVYHTAWEQDLHVARWGFKQFRVLFVTPVRERIAEMLAAVDFVTNGTEARASSCSPIFRRWLPMIRSDQSGSMVSARPPRCWIDARSRMFDTCHTDNKPTASSLRVVGIKATPAGRAHIILRGTCRRRDLDAADRTRTTERVAAPEIVAQSFGSPEIEPGIRTHARTCALHKPVLECHSACGRKPCSAKPSGKLKSKHIKTPPPGGFLISICFEIFGCEPLRTVSQDFSSAHHTPEDHVSGAHAPQYHTNLIRPRPDDRNQAPILDFLHGSRPIARRWLADRLPNFPILLNRSRLPDHFKRKCQEPEFQHLLRLAPLAFCRVPQVMQSFSVEDHGVLEVRATDRRVALKQFFGARSVSLVAVSIHKVRRV